MCVTIVGEKWSIGNTLNKIYHLLAPFMKDDGFKLRPISKNAKIGITM